MLLPTPTTTSSSTPSPPSLQIRVRGLFDEVASPAQGPKAGGLSASPRPRLLPVSPARQLFNLSTWPCGELLRRQGARGDGDDGFVWGLVF
jgi:hypothetical protein